MGVIKDVVGGLAKPITGAINKRTERKIQQDSIKGKLALARENNQAEVTFNRQEWERVGQSMQEKSWKDEYVTVSVVSYLNVILIGAIATAFGYGQVLDGVILAMKTLHEVNVNFGQILTVTVYAALGIYVFKGLRP